MKFRDQQEASLWSAVYAAYSGTNVGISNGRGGLLSPEAAADRAIESYRERASDLDADPYRGTPIVSNRK